MKKTLLLAALLLLGFGVTARPVDPDAARRVAETFMQNVGMKNTAALADITAQTPFQQFYVFAAPDGGFVLVSADDCVVPILGYSATSLFPTKEPMPEHVSAWLQAYDNEIQRLADLEAKHGRLQVDGYDQLAQQWNMLLAGAMPPAPLPTAVAPMLTTTWNQSPLYNNLCPYDYDADARTVTGCVATATAQVMKYWNHPTTGWGSHSYVASNSNSNYGTQSANFGNTTYQWSIMPTALTSTSSTAQINAVATLMYHIGVADEMKYDISARGGSGAQNYQYYGTVSRSSQNSLNAFFKYRPDMTVIARPDYSNTDYCTMMRNELNQSRPILYSGSHTSGGHSFVLDGYDNYGDFHINWGWGGSYDAYYTVGALNPYGGGDGSNGSGTYNMSNVALMGIRPNTSWSSTGSTTVAATVATGSPAGASVYGGGTYTFGDTINLLATAPAGYRFSGWSDGTKFNPREFVATGGSYSFSATYEPMTGNVLHYCPGEKHINSYGNANAGADKYWGIHLYASTLPAGNPLTAVQLYVSSAGTYDLTVYTGSQHSTTAATRTITFTTDQEDSWQTITLNTPVLTTEDIWLIFHNTDVMYPASYTYYSGANGSMIWGSDLDDYGQWWHGTFMVRGVFSNTTNVSGDTISYCGNDTYTNSVGAGGSVYWGIKFTPAQLTGRNYLSDVLLYTVYPGTYTLNVYSGGDTVPGTLLHTQTLTVNDTNSAWRDIAIDATVAINQNQNLWITFYNNGVNYPATGCAYINNPNSDWVSIDGIAWSHVNDYGLNYTWMIRAITAATQPSPVAPTVVISGPSAGSTGTPYTFTATATTGATVTWSLPGATPSTATGNTVTATWATAGTHTITATATNSNGTGTATHQITINSCGTVTTFPFIEDFTDNTGLTCWTMIDADGDGYCWDNTIINGTIASASYINNVGALTPDNWLITPQMQLSSGQNYTLTWKASGLDATYYAEHFGVFVSTTGTAPANFTMLQDYTTTSNQFSNYSLDLSAYAGQTIRLAFRHWNVTDMYWLLIDSVMVSVGGSTPPTPPTPTGDTISYCENNPYVSNVGAGGSVYWGVMFTPTQLTGRNYLSNVLLYTTEPGTYVLNVYSGGSTAPGTLVHTQQLNVYDTNSVWRNIALDATVPINQSQNLWVTFYCGDIDYPAAGCSYVNNPNSDWVSVNGTEWAHVTDYSLNYSWMIKAVTSATAPTPAGPSVTISGIDQAPVGISVPFNASAPAGCTITWQLQGATPSTGTGTTVSAYWNTPGLYNVIATATNSNGTGRDTLQIRIVDYSLGDTVSYCLDRSLKTTVGMGQPVPISWGIMLPASYLVNRGTIEHVMLHTRYAGVYTLKVYQGGNDAPGTLVATKAFTITDTIPAYRTLTPDAPITIDPTRTLWVTFSTNDISYPASTCNHTGDGNSDWVTINDTDWYHLPDLGINGSWMIKVITAPSQVQPTMYTITVASNNSSMGHVTGGGSFEAGSTAVIEAHPYNGYRFVRWQDNNTSNPRTITVTANATYTAYFEATGSDGIDDIVTPNLTVCVMDGTIIVEGSEGLPVRVYDAAGRPVEPVALPAGIYFVRVGNMPALKVPVVR